MGSAWAFQDTQTRHRRNREWILGRLLGSVHDVDEGGAVTVTAKAVDGSAVTTSESTPYTATTGIYRSIVHRIQVVNNDTIANQVSIHLVLSGGSRAVANRIFTETLESGEGYTIQGPWILNALDKIMAISSGATGTDVAIRADVLEFTSQPAALNLIADDGDALTASYATYYTCPASNVRHSNVVAITLCNTDSNTRTVDVQVIPSGQSASDTRKIFAERLLAGETVILCGPDDQIVLEPGDFIQAKASAAGVVSFRVTPVEFAT